MKKENEIKIPIRIRVISEIKILLSKAGSRGIFVEKLVAAYMEKEGLSRRLVLECCDSVHYSGFATYNKKDKILKKKLKDGGRESKTN